MSEAVDMNSLEYVDQEAAGKLECPFCMSVLDDPVVVCKNEHHLCRACAKEQQRSSDRCPTCRKRLDIRDGQRFLRSSLNDLRVHCPNRARGCSRTLRREELAAHMTTCSFTVVTCMHCDVKMERRLLGENGVHWHCDAARFGCDFVGSSRSDVAVHIVDCAVFKCRSQFEQYERRIAALERAAVPVGAMVAWSGAPSTLRDGWALCDGRGGRPDRREEFVEERRSKKRKKRRSCSRSGSAEGEGGSAWYSLAYIVRVEPRRPATATPGGRRACRDEREGYPAGETSAEAD